MRNCSDQATHQHSQRRRCGGRRRAPRARRAWLRCPWAVAGPGRASSRRAERSSPRGRLAGGPPPTGTPSSPAPQPGPPAPETPAAPHDRAGTPKGAGTAVPAPLSAHSATASSRLRPNDRQSWRRRRIHRNMPPTTAAPRPAPPIRPSKPVRARRWVMPVLGLVVGTSGAT